MPMSTKVFNSLRRTKFGILDIAELWAKGKPILNFEL